MANPMSTGREGNRFRFSLTLSDPAAAPEDAAKLSTVVAPFLDEQRVETSAASAIHTALEELLTNLGKFGRSAAAASRSEPLSAEGEIRADAAGVELRLIDNGDEFDPTLQPDPVFTDDPDLLVPGGLGLHMLRIMFTACAHSRVDGRNIGVWTIRY